MQSSARTHPISNVSNVTFQGQVADEEYYKWQQLK